MGNNFIENIWIDTKIFENASMLKSININKIYGLDSAYRIWEEANNTILNCNNNEEKLNQGFLSLKRAFNVTSIELRKNLAIDKIKYDSKKKSKDFLGDLEYFEIIKTVTISKYLKIRNLIEHENHLPPSANDCLSLSEYIWNYIRNTAYILNQFSECLAFDSDDNRYNKIIFEYKVEKKGKIYYPHLFITGLVSSFLVSFKSKRNFIDVEKIKLLNKFEIKKKIESEQYAYLMDDLSHIAFEGEILDQNVIAKYIKLMILPEYGGLDEISIKSIF
ncbi:hypothetical protein KQI68_01045 [Peptoniphilus sp. MSJ-1]|uniref:Uncharacterized protein n=1 Tax=Peptoniphilus ovalis TaxID=2841503 RepID=A0ABS6FFW1_9FIRM|nr:hypothetical protein [Peptoniphilus ovalis]MBU5668417.1 hypothetical protein [Peptoniphilus ovalis]